MPFRKIPRKLVPQGIELCKRNIADYLDDARTIISKGRLSHAFLSVQHAIEELGKVATLRKEYQKSNDDPILVDAAVFGRNGGKGHNIKALEAWKMLDPALKTLHVGGFEKGCFSEYGFDVDTEASHHSRLKCAYVDFIEDEQLWWIGEALDKSKVLALIDNIEEALKKL